MKRFFLLSCAFFILIFMGCATPYENQSFAMNTIITQSIYGDKSIAEKNNASFKQIEDLMSKTIFTSDIFKLNENKQGVVDKQTAYVIDFALSTAKKTNGAFNIALGGVIKAWDVGSGNEKTPSQEELNNLLPTTNYAEITLDGTSINLGNTIIDLGGIAKGYALDKAKENMKDAKSGLVVVGGSVYAKGSKPDGDYVIGLKDPIADGYMGKLTLKDKCISTSGIYERYFEKDGIIYSHIIDPKTLSPVQNSLLSVSVVDESGIVTDAYSTALFLMDLEEGLKFANENNIDALFITKDKKVHTTNNFDYNFEITEPTYEIL